jgi:hypothetical protein
VILPTKHLALNRSLLSVGGRILNKMRESQTVSALWNDLKASPSSAGDRLDISFDWFVLALDFLFVAGAVEFRGGMIRRAGS